MDNAILVLNCLLCLRLIILVLDGRSMKFANSYSTGRYCHHPSRRLLVWRLFRLSFPRQSLTFFSFALPFFGNNMIPFSFAKEFQRRHALLPGVQIEGRRRVVLRVPPSDVPVFNRPSFSPSWRPFLFLGEQRSTGY